MKTPFFAVFMVLFLGLTAFSANQQEVKSEIKSVTVFLRGAQVTRHASFNLNKGTSVLIFRDLPVNIDAQSIQVKGEGNFIILSIVHQINYLASTKKSTEVKLLQDSLEIYEEQIAMIRSMQTVLKNEEELLHANRESGSSEKGIVLSELKQLADFYRSRLAEIKKEDLKLNHDARKLQEKADRIKKQLEILNINLKQPTSEILVQISGENTLSGLLNLTYTVNDAGWIPTYDVRAKDVQNPVQLYYNASVFQNTGENWDNVSVKLSTANPQQRGEKPDLQPWYIDFEQPVIPLMQFNTLRSASKSREEFVADDAVAVAPLEVAAEEAETTAGFVNTQETQTNVEFNIKIPYDIPSDGKQYTINIGEYSLPASYEYYCAPKIDREAFLLARITGWEDYNLLAGEMNLFFEGTYVGKSFLSVRNTNDTLDLSLGRDKGIVVTRVKMKDFTEQKTIGNNRRETRAWDITIRNNKKQAIYLRVEDQIPVSMNKDIEVEPLDISGGKYVPATGLITWKQNIKTSDEKKFRVSFAVKYPKDQKVYLE